MADNSKIEWTDATWNVITGCSVISPGCTNCYAMKLAGTRLATHPSRAGLTMPGKSGPVWTGEVRFNGEWLTQPLEWTKPRMIFVCAHGDLFHESVPDAWLDMVFSVMALAPQHVFQVLTKRSRRLRAYLNHPDTPRRVLAVATAGDRKDSPKSMAVAAYISAWPLKNVWVGVSAEDQTRADERIPDLMETMAAVRWVSAEPLLSDIVLSGKWLGLGDNGGYGHGRLDWVVAGGESQHGSRPSHPNWFRGLRDQCVAAEVPFLFKQWGDWVSVSEVGGPGKHHQFPDYATVRRVGKKAAGRTLDGRTWDEMPKVMTHA